MRYALFYIRVLLVAIIGLIPSMAHTDELLQRELFPAVSNVSLTLQHQAVRPGSTVQGVIEFYLQPGWHLYWKNPGGPGLAPSFDWQLPQGITITDVEWPAPSVVTSGDTRFYGYSRNPKWLVTFAVDSEVSEGTYPITLSAFWLACDGSCVPGSQQYETSITVSKTAGTGTDTPSLENLSSYPSRVPEAEVFVQNDRLFLRLAGVREPSPADVLIIYPEQDGLFSIDQTPLWHWSNGFLSVSIMATPQAGSLLREKGHFSGIVQVISPHNNVQSYSFTSKYQPSVDEKLVRLFSHQNADSELTAPPQIDTTSFHWTLWLAVIGGFLLNFTPCVLPVVGLKLLTLLSFREPRWWKTFPHGLVYMTGILVTFWLLSGTLYLFEYLGTTVGWGFQLQNPFFVLGLIAIFFALSLNLFGLYEIGYSVSSWASRLDAQQGLNSSVKEPLFSATFISGILATLVATPCTGPFLGSVLGFTSTFSPRDGLLVFTCMGLGMSLPILLVTAFPILLYLFPKPGSWMVSLKQFLGFCVLGTIGWLLWVLNSEVPSLSLPAVLSGLIVFAFGLWIYGTWGTPVRSFVVRFVGRGLALFFVVTGIFCLVLAADPRVLSWAEALLPKRPSIQWEPFSQHRLTDEIHQGHIVLVRFSAKWCLSCQTNALAFAATEVAEAVKTHHVVALEADWTGGDPIITEQLRALGRNGVPVTVLFAKNQRPYILPELVTSDIIVHSIELISKTVPPR